MRIASEKEREREIEKEIEKEKDKKEIKNTRRKFLAIRVLFTTKRLTD